MKAVPALMVSLILAAVGYAQDARLEALRQILVRMRPKAEPPGIHLGAPPDFDTRDATPQLTRAKHQLRDWIESRLPPPDNQFYLPAVAATLNGQLKTHGLFVEDPKTDTFATEQARPTGRVNPIRMKMTGGFLIVQTGVGSLCGYDESAYLYEWKMGRWRRRWESEQNDYRKGKYKP